MADRLELEARFKDLASGGIKKLGKTLEGVKPTNGMQAANAWMKEFKVTAEKANAAVQPVTSTLTALGVGGLAASMSMSELVKQFKGLADGTLDMKELGRQSGMTIDQINRLQYAAGKLHVDPSAMNNAISSWSGKMVEFRRHTGRLYSEMIRNNSDVARKIAAESPEQGFKDMLGYMSRIPDAAMKAGHSAADAAQIQKRWMEEAGMGGLEAMAGKGPQGLAEAFADAGREVKPVAQSLIDAAEKMNDATNRMNQSWTNLKNDIGPAVLDPMSKMIDKLDETLKFAAKNPGDAAAVAGVGALSAAALYARRRIMAGSKIAGGTGLDRAAGELTGAAGALKQAAAALEGSKAVPGAGGAPGEGGKPGGGSFDKGRGLVAALGLAGVVANAPGMDEAGDRERDANASALESFGEAARKALGVDWLQGKVDEWRGAAGTDKWSHPDDDRLSRAQPADLKKDVQEGSKAGIIQGLRELAQQQELDGQGGAGGGLGGSGIGADGGTPNMRRGRSASGKWRSTPGTEGGAPIGKGAVGGVFKGGHGAVAGLAKESYDFWRGKGLDHNAALSMVAQEEGESGFDYRQQRGDSGLAHGAFSWHPDRRALIRAQTGINIDTATHLQQLEAAWHEGTKGSRAGFFQSLNGRDLRDAVYQGVHRFEGSRYQMKDTAARFGMARKWDGGGSFLAPKPAPSTPGAGTPTPSGAAVGDAEVFKARQRILNGSRDPADRALVDRYKAQQAQPEKHRAGGWIRGRGTGTSDSIPAMLSNGEYVVRAKAAGAFLPLLHAINSGALARFADGGPVGKPLTVHRAPAKPWVPPVGFGVAKRFYPTSSPAISDAEGAGNRRFWRDFFRKPQKDGGMGAPWRTTLAALAMMQGESGRGLNSKLYNYDVNGPSGGVDQLHDVTEGRGAGKLHRLSDLMKLAYLQHADWHDPLIQAANFKREALGDMNFAWRRMLAAKTARGALKEGIDKFENPAQHDLELMRRMPNILRLQREAVADGALTRHEIDPIQVDIRHHPHTGKPTVTARGGKGTKIGIRSGPTMQPS